LRAHEAREMDGTLIRAMLDPSFYPSRPAEVTHVETHISHLFLAGDLVYKIKKPVRFSFLDYSTLRKRRYFLEEEMRLNRRLAPSVYLGILPIAHENHSWRLGGEAHPVEYTLVMRRLPARRMLDFLLDRDLVTPPMMGSIAEVLAPFHAQAETGAEIQANGHPKVIRTQWEENLADIEPLVGQSLEAEAFERLKDFGLRFLIEHRDLFLRRVHEGRIREVHGDLHCEHICFAPEGIQIFDCIEFNPRLRCCDVASEVAFLVMDLECRGAGGLAQDFLARYMELTDDREIPLLLPFYRCYRALVRGKVAALRRDDAWPQAARYFDLAYRILWQEFQPFLVLLCGLTGSGKSALAAELSRRLGLPVISSDAIRKALAGSSERQDRLPYGEGIYSPSMTKRTYAKMAEDAGGFISQGKGAILDATFQRRAQRERILSLAAKYQIPLALIHCQSSEEVAQKRLKGREEEGRDLSDGRWEIYRQQKADFEPIQETAEKIYLPLDTEAAPELLVRRAERFLFSRLKKRS